MTSDQIARLDRESRGCASRDVYPARRTTKPAPDAMVSLPKVLDMLRSKRFIESTEDDAIIIYGAAFAEYLEQQYNEGALR